jgi:hypothetical protein
MIKYKIILLIIILSLFSCVNKKEQNNILNNLNNKMPKLNENLEINISGYFSKGGYYVYEIKKIENEFLLLIISTWYKNSEIYVKKISDNEIYDIYNFIKEHEIEQEIKLIGRWRAAEEFKGSFILIINDNNYKYEIHPDQDFENNLYTVLNFLNNLIDEKEYMMPIKGVRD